MMTRDDLHPGDHSSWTGPEPDPHRYDEPEPDDLCPDCGTPDGHHEGGCRYDTPLLSLASLDPRDPLFGVALGHLICGREKP